MYVDELITLLLLSAKTLTDEHVAPKERRALPSAAAPRAAASKLCLMTRLLHTHATSRWTPTPAAPPEVLGNHGPSRERCHLQSLTKVLNANDRENKLRTTIPLNFHRPRHHDHHRHHRQNQRQHPHRQEQNRERESDKTIRTRVSHQTNITSINNNNNKKVQPYTEAPLPFWLWLLPPLVGPYTGSPFRHVHGSDAHFH